MEDYHHDRNSLYYHKYYMINIIYIIYINTCVHHNMCIYNVYIYIYKYHDQFSECTFTYHIYIHRRKGHLLDFLDESSSGKSDTRLGSWRMERRMGQELVNMWVWVKINMSKLNTLETTDFNLFLVIIDLPIVGLPNFDLYPCMRMAYPIIPSFICSIIPSPFHSFMDSLIHSFMHSFVCSFVRSFIHSFIHSSHVSSFASFISFFPAQQRIPVVMSNFRNFPLSVCGTIW